jgi:hypothetical protein
VPLFLSSYSLCIERCQSYSQYCSGRSEAVDMNGRFQMQGGKNWILSKYINANWFFWDSHWLEIWSNHFCPSMGLNGGSVATDSDLLLLQSQRCSLLEVWNPIENERWARLSFSFILCSYSGMANHAAEYKTRATVAQFHSPLKRQVKRRIAGL